MANDSQDTQENLSHSSNTQTQRQAELIRLIGQVAPDLITENQLNVPKLQEMMGMERIRTTDTSALRTPATLTIRACHQMAQIIAAMEPACLKVFKQTRHAMLKWQWDQKPSPYDVPEIMHFIHGAPNLGFVMDPFDAQDFSDLHAINADPVRQIDGMGLSDLRRYIHTLHRADKWADGLSCPVLEALASGALQRAGLRLLDMPVST